MAGQALSPTELELLILKVLWQQAPLTVRQVREKLEAIGRPLAHTSVITTMGTMVEKGQLKKLAPTEGKAFRFQPKIDKEDVSQSMLGDLVQRVFDGSAEAVMLSLLDASSVDEDELKRLRKLLNQKLRKTRS